MLGDRYISMKKAPLYRGASVFGNAMELLMPIRDPTLCKVIRREFNVDPVAHKDPNTITAHTPGYGRQYHVIRIIQLNFEVGVRLLVNDDAGHFYQLFFHT
jgi:hypothetical protein